MQKPPEKPAIPKLAIGVNTQSTPKMPLKAESKKSDLPKMTEFQIHQHYSGVLRRELKAAIVGSIAGKSYHLFINHEAGKADYFVVLKQADIRQSSKSVSEKERHPFKFHVTFADDHEHTQLQNFWPKIALIWAKRGYAECKVLNFAAIDPVQSIKPGTNLESEIQPKENIVNLKEEQNKKLITLFCDKLPDPSDYEGIKREKKQNKLKHEIKKIKKSLRKINQLLVSEKAIPCEPATLDGRLSFDGVNRLEYVSYRSSYTDRKRYYIPHTSRLHVDHFSDCYMLPTNLSKSDAVGRLPFHYIIESKDINLLQRAINQVEKENTYLVCKEIMNKPDREEKSAVIIAQDLDIAEISKLLEKYLDEKKMLSEEQGKPEQSGPSLQGNLTRRVPVDSYADPLPLRPPSSTEQITEERRQSEPIQASTIEDPDPSKSAEKDAAKMELAQSGRDEPERSSLTSQEKPIRSPPVKVNVYTGPLPPKSSLSQEQTKDNPASDSAPVLPRPN
jgi:hypothetical protein